MFSLKASKKCKFKKLVLLLYDGYTKRPAQKMSVAPMLI